MCFGQCVFFLQPPRPLLRPRPCPQVSDAVYLAAACLLSSTASIDLSQFSMTSQHLETPFPLSTWDTAHPKLRPSVALLTCPACLRLPSPAPLRRECSECSLVVVSRGLSATKGINLNMEKLETCSVMRGSFILLDPRTWRTNCFQLWIGYLLWNYMNQIYISHWWKKKRRLEEYWFTFRCHASHMLTHRNTDKHKV